MGVRLLASMLVNFASARRFDVSPRFCAVEVADGLPLLALGLVLVLGARRPFSLSLKIRYRMHHVLDLGVQNVLLDLQRFA